SVTGTFSDSTIAINGTEHFNVSYTSTGVVLTVASGAAQPGGSSFDPLPKRQRVLTSGLRHRIAGVPQGGGNGLSVRTGNIGAHPAIIFAGAGLGRYQDWNSA